MYIKSVYFERPYDNKKIRDLIYQPCDVKQIMNYKREITGIVAMIEKSVYCLCYSLYVGLFRSVNVLQSTYLIVLPIIKGNTTND